MEELKLSHINLPVSLIIREVEITINKLVDGVFYDSENIAEENPDALQIKARKTKDITLSFDTNLVNYNAPLHIEIKKSLSATAIEVEAEGEIMLNMSTRFNIENDWKLTTKTEVHDYSWIQKPRLRVGMFDLPVKFIVNTILNRSKTQLCTTIDKELSKNFDLQSYVNEAWKLIQPPILLSEEYFLWLDILPVQVGMTPLVSDGIVIKSTIMIQAFVSVVIGENPPPKSSAVLPAFQLIDTIAEDFLLSLRVLVQYPQAEKIIRRLVAGKTFSYGLLKFTPLDIGLSGTPADVVVTTRWKGSYNGDLVLSGNPFFDAGKNEVEVKNLQYRLKTRNLLIKFITWLFRKPIEKQLSKHARFQVAENINGLMNMLESRLKEFELTENVFLEGNLSKLAVENLKLQENGFELSIVTSGKLNLHVKKIDIQNIPST